MDPLRLVPVFLLDLSGLAFLSLIVFSPLQPLPCCENFTTPLVSLPVGPSPKPLLEQKWRFPFRFDASCLCSGPSQVSFWKEADGLLPKFYFLSSS